MKNDQPRMKKATLKTSEEFDFFVHSPLTKYEGMYVAILGRKVVASGKSAKDAWLAAQKKYPKELPTLAKIPKKEFLAYAFC